MGDDYDLEAISPAYAAHMAALKAQIVCSLPMADSRLVASHSAASTGALGSVSDAFDEPGSSAV